MPYPLGLADRTATVTKALGPQTVKTSGARQWKPMPTFSRVAVLTRHGRPGFTGATTAPSKPTTGQLWPRKV